VLGGLANPEVGLQCVDVCGRCGCMWRLMVGQEVEDGIRRPYGVQSRPPMASAPRRIGGMPLAGIYMIVSLKQKVPPR